jgi:hypothetical protein
MPLDHVRGERVEGMDSVFVVAPFEKYAEQTRLTASIKEVRQFKRDRIVEKPIVEVAMRHAKQAFDKIGLPVGSEVDILVQEYVRVGVVLFLFCARINGTDYFVKAPFQLGEEQIRDLTHRGLWTPYRLN